MLVVGLPAIVVITAFIILLILIVRRKRKAPPSSTDDGEVIEPEVETTMTGFKGYTPPVKTVPVRPKQDFPKYGRKTAEGPTLAEPKDEGTLALPPKNRFTGDEVVIVHVPDEK